MRVNLGCGEFLLKGHVNVDAYDPRADVVADMRTLDFEGVEHVNMEHSLEHVPWPDVFPLLKRIRSWMASGGTLHVEVPDMGEIMRRGDSDALWVIYTYGSQSPHAGEFHRSGFTEGSLKRNLLEAGWQVDSTRTFLSTHVYRPDMPCLEADAHV